MFHGYYEGNEDTEEAIFFGAIGAQGSQASSRLEHAAPP